MQRLKDYIEKHEGGLITAIRNETDNSYSFIIYYLFFYASLRISAFYYLLISTSKKEKKESLHREYTLLIQ